MNHAFDNAHAWMDSIKVMMARYDLDSENDEVLEEIFSSPLSIQVRCDHWTAFGEDMEPTHYRIVLTVGGPFLAVTGEYSEALAEPTSASLVYADQSIEEKPLPLTELEQEALLRFAQMFFLV